MLSVNIKENTKGENNKMRRKERILLRWKIEGVMSDEKINESAINIKGDKFDQN